jgi:anti-sigma B factor antagonist
VTIQTTVQGKAAVIALDGRMDADQAGLFEAECDRVVAQGCTHIIVDLAKLQYVSSMGLRSFLHVAKARQAANGGLALANFRGFVKQVFDVTRLTPLFRIYDTVDQALESMP